MADPDSLLLPVRVHAPTHTTGNPIATSLSPSNQTRCLVSWTKLEEASEAGPRPGSILPWTSPYLLLSLSRAAKVKPQLLRGCPEISGEGWGKWGFVLGEKGGQGPAPLHLYPVAAGQAGE